MIRNGTSRRLGLWTTLTALALAARSLVWAQPATAADLKGTGTIAQTFDELHVAATKQNPAGVTFEIKLDRNSFRMGEVIPLELAFSSTEKERWQLDGGLYDRSGRMFEESYCLDPADAAPRSAGRILR